LTKRRKAHVDKNGKRTLLEKRHRKVKPVTRKQQKKKPFLNNPFSTENK